MSDVSQVQTCYRHPDRRANILCQRCERAICPNCMHDASVGFHCPECLQAHSQRVARGPAAFAPGRPYVTFVLIALNVAVFAAGLVLDPAALSGRSTQLTVDFSLFGPAVAAGEWYRLVTSGFLHHGAMHLGFNMYALYLLGQSLESAVGRAQYLATYIGSMLAGSLGVLLLQPRALTAGASGAVFGLFGLIVATQRAAGINPFQTQIGSVLMLNLFITFAVPGISIGGHLGGLAGGFAIGSGLIAMRKAEVPQAGRVAVVIGLSAVVFAAGLLIA